MNVSINKSKLDYLADVIAIKSGEAVTMTIDEMAEAVNGIQTGEGITPTGTITITQNGQADVTQYATADVQVTASLQSKTKTYTPTTSTQTEMVTADSGYDGLSAVSVTVNAVPSASFGLLAVSDSEYYTDGDKFRYRTRSKLTVDNDGWIENGTYYSNYASLPALPANTYITPSESTQTVGGVNYVMRGDVTVGPIASNYVGSGITRRSSSDLTASGATVTVPSGYYSAQASKSVSNGTAGTPTATKGTVSNHSVSVTPSVTNTTGYIDGGTITGTAVSVSASELVSGTYTVDSSGTKDVTNYASASVPSGTAGTPSASKGSVSNHAISVTPSVTNTTGWITGSTKTGTAVSVSASELVSGTYTVSASGTHNVTNYASASVASGTATASATKGAVSNHSVSVTPSVTRTAGYITAGSSSGTAVTVSASELVSGSQTITQNGTVNVTNLAEIVVNVEGGGGSSAQVDTAMRAPGGDDYTAIFTGLKGQPTSFYVSVDVQVNTTAQAAISAVVYDGSSIHTQTITNTTNAQVSYVSTGVSYTYSNGTLTLTSTGAEFVDDDYSLTYTYGGSASDIDTFSVQVGSGATSITFTGLEDEPIAWSCIFKSNFSTSSGYQRVIATGYNGTSVTGLAMDSAAHPSNSYWTQSYSNGSLTITSQGTNQGGYFHQPGYYQLTAVYGEIEPQEIDVVPLSVTTNGTYTAPSGTAYSPVTVNVSSGGGVNVATTTWSNSDASATTHTFTGLSGTPKAAFLRCTSSLSRSSSSSNYFIADMRWTGTAAAGNSFRRSNGTYANVTSGYSFSASGTSLTVTTTGTSTSNPGSFYNGTYELTYIY